VEPVLCLERITKSFGPVPVLRGVDFDVRPGEVHSLVGENGAGKSTLMKIAAGIHQADTGCMLLEGGPYSPRTPRDAINSGIAMVHQELSLAPDVSVAENIFIGSEMGKGVFVDWRKLNSRATKVLSDFCLSIDPATPVSGLSVGYRQVIEILKALATNPRVIIFDEPTSSLEAHESALVLDTIGKLAAKSIGVVYITHRMDEVFQVSDRITVLRDGTLAGVWNAADVSREQVVNAMVGREMTELYPPRSDDRGDELLRVDDLSRGRSFRGISFSLHKGEILGFSGLVGAGRTEVMRAIFGADPAESGVILVQGKPLRIARVKDAMAAGIAYVPEERKVDGLFLDRSLEDNIISGNLDLCSRGGWMVPELSRALAGAACQRLKVVAHGIDQGTGTLSGGNQQKVLLVRWLTTKPRILIVDEPTRGVDVGAKVEIHRILREYAQAGNGVIVVSSEMPEIIGLCDRIVILREGSVVGELPGRDATEEKLVKLAVG
jgi:ABC-type sugar transport system ATPase subunit